MGRPEQIQRDLMGGMGLDLTSLAHLGEATSETPIKGERALLTAILFDGIQSFINYVCAQTESEKKRYQEAFLWVKDNRTDYIFSFENVCDCLGINADYLRCGLINAANSQSYEWRKIRRTF